MIPVLLLLLALSPGGGATGPEGGFAEQHPDVPGLLALKATICGDNCTELSTWTPAGDPCSFDGVYCGWVLGSWRVFSVQLQLDAASVSFNDSAMWAHAGGSQLAGLEHLRELEVLCVQHRPTPPAPGPPEPPPVPSNTPQQQQQQQPQQGTADLPILRQQLRLGAATEQQGLLTSRWLAATEAAGSSPLHGQQSALELQQEHLQWQPHVVQHVQPPPPPPPPPQQQQQQPAAAGGLPYSWFAAYPRLTHLRVVGCGAAGVLQSAAIAQARHLASLVLSHNRLQGTLGDEFVGLKGLSVLDLSGNQLSGSLPLSWVGMQHLHYLYLNNNNFTGVLPCEWAQLQLLLGDLSGNRWHSLPVGGGDLSLGCGPTQQGAPAALTQPGWRSSGGRITLPALAPPAPAAAGGSWRLWQGAAQQQRPPPPPPLLQQQQGAVPGSSGQSSNSGSRGARAGQLRSVLNGGAAGSGTPIAPRCWLRRYCYDEGAFICLQRKHSKAAASEGCSSYVYGASDLHTDPLNQCDHGGSHLAAICAMFTAFAAMLLLMWLHHCRVMRWMSQPSSMGGAGSYGRHSHRQRSPQAPQGGPWKHRQWLISGPSTPTHRARARSLGGGAGGAAVHTSSSTTTGLQEPLLPHQAPPTLPLLYHPATSEHEGAGYSSPVSSSSAAADFMEAVAVGTPEGVLPSALTTPSAGAISIRPLGGGGFGAAGAAQSRPLGGPGKRSTAAGRGRGGAAGRSGGAAAAAAALAAADPDPASSSGYESDSSSSAGGFPVGGDRDRARNRTTAHLSAHWLRQEYYFQGNEPLPPWAGGVARLLATLAPTAGVEDAGSGGGRGSSGCFSPALLLPLVCLLLVGVTHLRLLLLWGVGPPPHVKLWPSYALLGLMVVPHLLVGAVVHFRLLAVSCLPPALKAAAIREDQLSQDILPPGASAVVKLYGWLFAAPAWLAYPLILLLLAPGVLLLTLLCPLVLPMAACGRGSYGGVVRYIQLLQGCTALTQSSGSAGLLTVLFLMGNVPLEWAFLDSSLYYLTAAADLANMGAAWWLRLQALRRQQALALAALPGASGQQWT